MMKPALLWESSSGGSVRCRLCSHRCEIAEGRVGLCGVRENREGRLVSLVYDRVIAANNDPIEKKPLYHFLPGSESFSVATMGCNFHCTFCQNHNLSMVNQNNPIHGRAIAPTHLVESALQSGSSSIAYTYTEPTVFYELMLETAHIASENGLKNIMVTNGYITLEALEKLTPVIDAANVDLKAFNDRFYRRYTGARLEPVLDTISAMKQAGIWMELTTLLISGLNDDPEEIRKLIEFIIDLDPSIPWHVSRFYPTFQMQDREPTPADHILRVLETAREAGLNYLYAGNVADRDWLDTHCPRCGERLIRRSGYSAETPGLSRGRCRQCAAPIPGVWE